MMAELWLFSTVLLFLHTEHFLPKRVYCSLVFADGWRLKCVCMSTHVYILGTKPQGWNKGEGDFQTFGPISIMPPNYVMDSRNV